MRIPLARSIPQLFVALTVVTVTAAAQQSGNRHPISGRVFALPMSVDGAPWLERGEREREEDPDTAVRLMRISRGASVADIGAGSGYYTLRLARAVGEKGTVFATDLQPGMLDLLRTNVVRARLSNVTPVLGTASDPNLPPDSIDLALMVDVYHELSQPQEMLRRIHTALKPGGRLVLLEYRAEDPAVPIRPEHKMTKAQVKQEVEPEGFRQQRVHDDLPWQHLVVFSKE